MGGGVSPFEWIVPPVAISHTLVDQGASLAGQKLPPVPGSATANADEQTKQASDQAARNQQLALDQQSKAEQDLNARTETPQEALDARRRAQAASTALAGGQRRASQTLTTQGQSLSGSY